MKTTRRILLCSSIGTLSLLLSSIGFISSFNNSYSETKAYTSSELPTTIDLNDNSESEIREYYSPIDSLPNSERQGTNLLIHLKDILRNGQKYYSYDETNSINTIKGLKIWQMYEIIDRDWKKSPASSTTYGTYDSINNRLVNYQYGTGSGSYSKNNPYLHALYVNRDVDNQVRAWGDHSQTTGWGINREHIWAKSHGFNSEDNSSESAGARGDPMHLWSASGYINATPNTFRYHNNLFFGFVNTEQSYYSTATDGSGFSFLSGNYEGAPLNVSKINNKNVFEPQDSDKGDIARAIFYMVARYNFYSGEDNDTIDANNPNLQMLDAAWDWNYSKAFDCDESTPATMGVLRDLLAWNRLDPPDEWEIHRNNLLFNNYTNNRNPFIDYPEWAEYIWGKSTLEQDNRTISSYNSSPTGYATPSSDIINDFKVYVPVNNVTIDSGVSEMEVGDSFQLEYTVYPADATNQDVYFYTSNENVLAVSDSGVVTAVGSGSASIYVRSVDGDVGDDSLYITVSSFTPTSEYSLTSGSPYINGIPYKMYFKHTLGSGSNYYFTGSLTSNTYYGSTSTSINSAVDVYFESANSGQYLYFNKDNAKQYLYVVESYKNNTYYYNFAFDITPREWQYNSIYSCMIFTLNSNMYTFGTRNTYNTMSAIYPGNLATADKIDFITSNSNDDETISATGLATIMKDYISCDSTGNTAPGYKAGASWSTFEWLYSKFDSDAKLLLSSTISNVNGNLLEQGLARYDYIISKYNTSSTTPYNDFLGRISSNQVTLNTNNYTNYSDSNTAKIIVIVICATTLAFGLSTLLLVRKKRKLK